VKTTLLIFFLATGIPAGFQFKQRHDLEERAVTATRTLRGIYVLTPNQSVRLVYMPIERAKEPGAPVLLLRGSRLLPE
jgi:hypothetical protein